MDLRYKSSCSSLPFMFFSHQYPFTSTIFFFFNHAVLVTAQHIAIILPCVIPGLCLVFIKFSTVSDGSNARVHFPSVRYDSRETEGKPFMSIQAIEVLTWPTTHSTSPGLQPSSSTTPVAVPVCPLFPS